FVAANGLTDLDRLNPGMKLFLPDKRSPALDETWILPTNSRLVTSGYGRRSYPRLAFHDGLDLRSRYEPVKAARSRRIIYSGWMGGYGKCVVIEPHGGFKTLYGHNSQLRVSRGQAIAQGQVIAISGNTGYSYGPHVHFEIHHNGHSLNPARYLRG